MGFFDFFKGRANAATATGFSGYSVLGLEVKKAYDAQRIGIQGRPQYPLTDVAGLFRWSQRNELVFACLRKIAQAAIDPEIVVEKRANDGEWKRVDGHPLTMLLQRPNSQEDGSSFIGAWLTSEHIAGEFYAEIVRNRIGQPLQLWPLNPAAMNPIPGPGVDGNPIVAYEFTNTDGQRIRLEAKDVMVRRNRDLTNIWHGLSPLAVALGAVDADQAQTDYIRAFFNNDGIPSGLLKIKNRTLTEEQARATQNKWMARYGRGGAQYKGVAVLDDNADYQKIGAGLDEIASETLRGQVESRITMAFGVPPILVGAYVGLVNVNQRASVREAQQDFWLNTMSPLFTGLRQFLTWTLLPEFESVDLIKAGRVRCNWDISQVMALQEDKDKHHDRARKDYLAGLVTQNEARSETGRKPAPDGNKYYQRVQVAPAGAEATPNAADANAKAAPKSIAPLQVKTTAWDGMELGREPSELEMMLDLKGMAETFDTEKARLAKVFTALRQSLIAQAVKDLRDSAAKDAHTLILTPKAEFYTRAAKEAKRTYDTGRAQVIDDLRRQRTAKNLPQPEHKADGGGGGTLTWLERLIEAAISRVVNHLQGLASGFWATSAMLELDDAERITRLETQLTETSLAPLELIAAATANVALGNGRDDEIEARKDEWKSVTYSALLDKSTCGPCSDADGESATDTADLTPAPNPDCEGGALCRCFIIAVIA